MLDYQLVLFWIGIIGVIFTVYHYFRNPQIRTDKRDAIQEQQFKWVQETTERRFKDIQGNFTDLLSLNQNHLHTIDTKIEVLNEIVSSLGKDIVKLQTIVEERYKR